MQNLCGGKSALGFTLKKTISIMKNVSGCGDLLIHKIKHSTSDQRVCFQPKEHVTHYTNRVLEGKLTELTGKTCHKPSLVNISLKALFSRPGNSGLDKGDWTLNLLFITINIKHWWHTRKHGRDGGVVWLCSEEAHISVGVIDGDEKWVLSWCNYTGVTVCIWRTELQSRGLGGWSDSC